LQRKIGHEENLNGRALFSKIRRIIAPEMMDKIF